jgi:hypothetical protein
MGTCAGRLFHRIRLPVDILSARPEPPMEIPSRFFLCGRCRAQVLVCSYCDRGQIYCAGKCAQQARTASMRAAGARYQASRIGRFNHAARSRRYRARLRNVTHQGSPPTQSDALLAVNSTAAVKPSVCASPILPAVSRCYFCGRAQSAFVRTGPLRRRVRRIACQPDQKGADCGRSP